MTSPHSTARVILIEKRAQVLQLLVMERFRYDTETNQMLHYYSIPGGHIESQETPEQTAVREIAEEMALQIDIGPLVAINHTKDGAQHYFYTAKRVSGEPTLPADSPEALDHTPDNRFIPHWVELNDESLANLHGVFRHLSPLILQLAAHKLPAAPLEHFE